MDVSRDDILFAAEVATRYHRRRASFLSNADKLLTLFQLAFGAAAFAVLLGPGSTIVAQVATLAVTLAALLQAVFGTGVAACRHESWLRRWSDLLVEVQLDRAPSPARLESWLRTRAVIEQECVGELRALEVDCRNQAQEVLGWTGDIYKIGWLQRKLLPMVSFQSEFPAKV